MTSSVYKGITEQARMSGLLKAWSSEEYFKVVVYQSEHEPYYQGAAITKNRILLPLASVQLVS